MRRVLLCKRFWNADKVFSPCYGIRAHSVEGRDYIFKMGFHVINVMKTSVSSTAITVWSMIEKTQANLYRCHPHQTECTSLEHMKLKMKPQLHITKAADMTEKKTSVKYERNYIENISSTIRFNSTIK